MQARTVASLATAVGLGLLASAAQANIVTGTLGGASYTVTCGADAVVRCTLLESGPAGQQGTTLTEFAAVNGGSTAANPTNEVNYLNSLVNPDFTAAQVTTVNTTNNGESIDLSIFGPYFWLKIDGQGAGYLYFQNNDGTQTVNYSASGTSTGLSHYAQVPLPAAALLFLTGLGGLVGWRRWSGQGEGSAPQMA